MTKQVLVVAYCDGEHDDQVRATVERHEQGKVLDLCPACSVSFEEAVEAVKVWLRRGSPEQQQPKKRRASPSTPPPNALPDIEFMRTCQTCGYECPTRTALGQHVKKIHGKKLGDYDWSLQ